MASICTRCALRFLRDAERQSYSGSKRLLSSTAPKRKAIPTFAETSNPKLDDVLATLRNKHFIPSALTNVERKLIWKPKNKQVLEDNPQTTTIGDEEIQLQWMDRMSDIPSRRKLISKALELMSTNDPKDWNNLPALLTALHQAKITLDRGRMSRIIRLATNSGRFGTILQCLHQAQNTGMTLKNEEVLDGVIWGLHNLAQSDGWSEEATAKAIRDANEVAMQLEEEKHGSGKNLQENDPRRRPEVIGVFLELAAVYAYKFQDGKDVDGKVKAYSERLLSNIGEVTKPKSTEPASMGPQLEVLHGVPIWHGLRLAQKILGDDMPKVESARQIVQDYEDGLATIVEALKANKPEYEAEREAKHAAKRNAKRAVERKAARKAERKPKKEGYDDQAIRVWRNCIRD